MIDSRTDAHTWALEFTLVNQLEHELSKRQTELAKLLTQIMRLKKDVARALDTLL